MRRKKSTSPKLSKLRASKTEKENGVKTRLSSFGESDIVKPEESHAALTLEEENALLDKELDELRNFRKTLTSEIGKKKKKKKASSDGTYSGVEVTDAPGTLRRKKKKPRRPSEASSAGSAIDGMDVVDAFKTKKKKSRSSDFGSVASEMTNGTNGTNGTKGTTKKKKKKRSSTTGSVVSEMTTATAGTKKKKKMVSGDDDGDESTIATNKSSGTNGKKLRKKKKKLGDEKSVGTKGTKGSKGTKKVRKKKKAETSGSTLNENTIAFDMSAMGASERSDERSLGMGGVSEREERSLAPSSDVSGITDVGSDEGPEFGTCMSDSDYDSTWQGRSRHPTNQEAAGAVEPSLVQKGVSQYVATFAFEGDAGGTKLSFPSGAFITAKPNQTGAWWWGSYYGAEGWFPPTYVTEYQVQTAAVVQSETWIQESNHENDDAPPVTDEVQDDIVKDQQTFEYTPNVTVEVEEPLSVAGSPVVEEQSMPADDHAQTRVEEALMEPLMQVSNLAIDETPPVTDEVQDDIVEDQPTSEYTPNATEEVEEPLLVAESPVMEEEPMPANDSARTHVEEILMEPLIQAPSIPIAETPTVTDAVQDDIVEDQLSRPVAIKEVELPETGCPVAEEKPMPANGHAKAQVEDILMEPLIPEVSREIGETEEVQDDTVEDQPTVDSRPVASEKVELQEAKNAVAVEEPMPANDQAQTHVEEILEPLTQEASCKIEETPSVIDKMQGDQSAADPQPEAAVQDSSHEKNDSAPVTDEVQDDEYAVVAQLEAARDESDEPKPRSSFRAFAREMKEKAENMKEKKPFEAANPPLTEEVQDDEASAVAQAIQEPEESRTPPRSFREFARKVKEKAEDIKEKIPSEAATPTTTEDFQDDEAIVQPEIVSLESEGPRTPRTPFRAFARKVVQLKDNKGKDIKENYVLEIAPSPVTDEVQDDQAVAIQEPGEPRTPRTPFKTFARKVKAKAEDIKEKKSVEALAPPVTEEVQDHQAEVAVQTQAAMPESKSTPRNRFKAFARKVVHSKTDEGEGMKENNPFDTAIPPLNEDIQDDEVAAVAQPETSMQESEGPTSRNNPFKAFARKVNGLKEKAEDSKENKPINAAAQGLVEDIMEKKHRASALLEAGEIAEKINEKVSNDLGSIVLAEVEVEEEEEEMVEAKAEQLESPDVPDAESESSEEEKEMDPEKLREMVAAEKERVERLLEELVERERENAAEKLALETENQSLSKEKEYLELQTENLKQENEQMDRAIIKTEYRLEDLRDDDCEGDHDVMMLELEDENDALQERLSLYTNFVLKLREDEYARQQHVKNRMVEIMEEGEDKDSDMDDTLETPDTMRDINIEEKEEALVVIDLASRVSKIRGHLLITAANLKESTLIREHNRLAIEQLKAKVEETQHDDIQEQAMMELNQLKDDFVTAQMTAMNEKKELELKIEKEEAEIKAMEEEIAQLSAKEDKGFWGWITGNPEESDSESESEEEGGDEDSEEETDGVDAVSPVVDSVRTLGDAKMEQMLRESKVLMQF